MGCEEVVAVLVVVDVDGLDGLVFFKLSIQHLLQQPPVASDPKNPHPLLHKTGVAGGCCSLLALMV